MENITNALSGQSPAAIATYVMLGLVGLLALIGALKGLSRGISRQIVRSLTIIISVVLSIFAVKFAYGFIFGYFDGKTIQDILNQIASYGVQINMEEMAWLNNFDTETVKYILAIPLALVIMPIVFTILFVVISALMLIVHAIISGILGFRKRNNNFFTRILGMALGAVQGAFVAIVLLVPILGIASTASASVETLRQNEVKNETEAQVIELYDNYVKEAIDSPVFTYLNNFGGNFMYRILATANVAGENVVMPEQLDPVVSAYLEYSANLVGADFKNLTPENKQAIKAIIAEIEASNYYSPLLAGLVRGASLTLTEGEFLAELEEPIKSTAISIISIFHTADKYNISTDLNTFCDLYFLLSDEGILNAMGGAGEGEEQPDIMQLLSKKDENGKTTISRVIDVLSANDRTKPIVSSLTKLSIAIISSSAGDALPPDSAEKVEEVYNTVKDGLNTVVQVKRDDYATEEEYKGAVSSSLENVLVDSSILSSEFIEENREEVDKVLDVVADHVIENFGDVEEVTDEHITEVILEYYEAYVNGDFNDILGGGSLPEELPEGIPGTIPTP